MEAWETELLALEANGLLNPRDVVEWARSHPKSALHAKFNWDVEAAAMEYWLIQARKLIVSVTVVPVENTPIQMYVSLKSDRNTEGGYRQTVKVLSNADMREQLLQQAFADFEYWQQKYQTLAELAPVFEAAKRAKSKKKT